jgi:hypothetical protein
MANLIQSNANGTADLKEVKLPGRDLILMPLLGLLTIGLIAASTELIARLIFTESATREDRCIERNDLSTGWRGIPNCVNWAKGYESNLMKLQLNGSGYRADTEFGPKQPGTYRIVMVGSSFAMGLTAQSEKTAAISLPAELSARTGRKVELYNEAIEGWGGTPRNIASRFNKALLTQPDMVLWILTMWDIRNASGMWPSDEILPNETRRFPEKVASTDGDPAVSSGVALLRARVRSVANSNLDAVKELWHNSRSDLMLTHFLYEIESQSAYLKSSNVLHNDAMYLGAVPSEKRLRHLREFEGYAVQIEAQARAADVPLVAVLLPNRQNAAVISMGEWPPDIDPFNLDNELRSIIVGHGGTYIDILPAFRGIPNAEKGYLPVDGHPNAEGNAMITGLLAKALTSGAVPALKADEQPQSTAR